MRLWNRTFLVTAGLVFTGLPARGLTINLSYDSSVTMLPYASDVENATQYAATQLQNVLTNNITININVVASDNAFGGSGTGLGGIYSYSDIRNFLTNNATTPVDTSAVTMMNALPDPTQGGNFWIPGAEMKALGLSDANGTDNDGTFTFGTNNPWNFSTTNRAVSGEYDFVGVALHELTECIGRTSVLGGSVNNAPGWIPFDLFRFVQPEWESTNNHDNGVYFSVDQGNTNLKNYNPASNGGDLQDWAAGTPDAADQASVQGTENDLSPADIVALDAIGYTPVTAARTLTWDGSSSLLDSSHWLNSSNQNMPAYIGAALVVNNGTLTYTPPDVHSNLVLSNSSIYGTGLTITGGSVSTIVNPFVSGLGPGTGAGLYLNSGSTLAISGTGELNLAGALVIAGDVNSFINATITGGSINVGEDHSSNVDPTLYIGYAGDGTLTQSGSSTVNTTNLVISPSARSMGTYTINSGTLNVSGATVLSGTTSAVGSGTFTMNAGTMSTGTLTIWRGTFTNNGNLTVSGATINNGEISLTGGAAKFSTISGTGTLFIRANAGAGETVTASSVNQPEIWIDPNCKLTISSAAPTTNSTGYLVVLSNGKLDVTDNVFDVNNAPNSDAIPLIHQLLTSGYADGAWNGSGIISSTAASDPSHSTSLGYEDTGAQIIIKYTWVGDTNLDGVVDSSDLTNIKSNGTMWATGDFNYDSVVNEDDYSLFMLGSALSGGANISTLLLEPNAFILMLLCGLAPRLRKKTLLPSRGTPACGERSRTGEGQGGGPLGSGERSRTAA